MIYHHRDGAQARSSPPRGRGTLGQRYEDDSLSFVAIKKVSSPLARTPTREGSGAQSAFIDNMHIALEQKHKGVPMLAPALEPEVLNKEPELAAIVAAPGGAPRGPIGHGVAPDAANRDGPMGGVKTCSDQYAVGQDGGAGGPQQGPGAVVALAHRLGHGQDWCQIPGHVQVDLGHIRSSTGQAR